MGDDSLKHVASRTYTDIKCNWKVFCDNYLDGGYHVPMAHPALASNIKMDSYRSVLFDQASVQLCGPQAQSTGVHPSHSVNCGA